MLKEFALEKAENPFMNILAVVFKNPENLNSTSKLLEYTIRSEVVPKSLFETPMELISGIKAFLETIPFTQVQMCLDESFLNKTVPNPSYKTDVSIICIGSI